jgi:hypothetical protein
VPDEAGLRRPLEEILADQHSRAALAAASGRAHI